MKIRFFLILFGLCSLFFGQPAHAEMQNYPTILLQSLDKGTARTMTFEAKVGSTIKYGPLYIKIRACRKAPPIETPESAAFLQIWEINSDDEAEWVFSGWMFASSPALSPMDHPIYDVWVLDCKGEVIEDTIEESALESDRADGGVVMEEGDNASSATEKAAMPEETESYNDKALEEPITKDSGVTPDTPVVPTFDQMNTGKNLIGSDIEVENLMEE